MTSYGSQWSYRPRITFQDTNLVGNVYFLAYFRWQMECIEEWLHQADRSRQGESTIMYPIFSSTRFRDPVGATVGDCVLVRSNVTQSIGGRSVSSTINRQSDGVESIIANGEIAFSDRDWMNARSSSHPVGPCYEYNRSYPPRLFYDPLDLLSLQGKCRELFLLDHAPETIRRIASLDLALQTTSASVNILSPRQKASGEVKVELRLEALKCGQMTVRFDYFELDAGRPVHFACGQQRMSCKRRYSHGLLPTPLPADVLCALRQFTDDGQLLEKITEIERFSERAPQPHGSDCVP